MTIPTVEFTYRDELEDQIERLIDLLDQLDPDPDLEEPGDLEPWLGWDESGQLCDGQDREEECEDEGAQCDDEGAIDYRSVCA